MRRLSQTEQSSDLQILHVSSSISQVCSICKTWCGRLGCVHLQLMSLGSDQCPVSYLLYLLLGACVSVVFFSKCADTFGAASHNSFLRWANLYHSISMFPAASSSLCMPVRHNFVWRSKVKIITKFASVVSAIFKRNFKWWWEVELAARSTVANTKKLDERTVLV